MLQQEAVVSEQQSLFAKLAAKDSETNSIKEDIIQMTKIVSEMCSLNNDLHKKVEVLNENNQQNLEKILEMQSSERNNEEVQKKYEVCVNERNEVKIRLEEAEKTILSYKFFLENKFRKDFDKFLTILNELENNLPKLPYINTGKDTLLEKLALHIESIEKSLQQTLKNSETNKESLTNPLSTSFHDSKVKELESKEKVLQSRITEMITNAEKIKKDYNVSLNNMKKIIETFKEQNSSLLEKNHNLLSEFEKKDSELQKLKSKILNLTTKYENSTNKSKEFMQKENEYKSIITNLEARISGINDERKSTTNQLNIREKRIKGVLGQIQILREEIFAKDSEILKKAREISKLESFLESLKAQMQKINSKIKISDAEVLAKINSEIEAKDKQIAMLKEMLRSSNQEIKAKEGVISHFKRKSEGLSTSSKD